MILSLVIVGILFLLSVTSLIIFKGKRNLILNIISSVSSLVFLLFYFVDSLNFIIFYYDFYLVLLVLLSSIFYIPKKVTKNITEYDFFELEKEYKDLEADREKLRERYLSTISLIDEGIIFYENNFKDVILSDRSLDFFKGEQSLSFNEHVERIYEVDRPEYIKTIEKTSKVNKVYQINYRILDSDDYFWVTEKGHFIGVDSKKSIIATIVPQNVKLHKSSLYFDIDSLNDESKLYPILKNYLDHDKKFYFISFELSNIPEINKKYSREMGSLMMSEYLKMIRSEILSNQAYLFRITGIRFSIILDDENAYNKFHDYLVNDSSIFYKTKIKVSNVKDIIIPNFSVIKLDGTYAPSSVDVINLSMDLLDESTLQRKKRFVIHND